MWRGKYGFPGLIAWTEKFIGELVGVLVFEE
jgi:hypothetical protein